MTQLLSIKAEEQIKSIANKENRRFSKTFEVLENDNILTLKDIKGGLATFDWDKKIKEPKFAPGTSPKVKEIIKDCITYIRKTGFNKVCLIPVDILHTPSFQRPIDINRANKIAMNFDREIFDPIKVYYDIETGLLYVYEGDHRTAAAIMLKLKYIPGAITVDKTTAEVSQYFRTQNKQRKKLKPIEALVAGVGAKDPNAIAAVYACNLFRVKIRTNGSYPKKINSVNKMNKIVEQYGPEGLKLVFQFICDAGWENQPQAYHDTTLSIGLAILNFIRTSNGTFKYDKFVEWARTFDTCVECVKRMYNDVKSVVSAKHPEDSPAIYIEKFFM